MSFHNEQVVNRDSRPGPDLAIVGKVPLSDLSSRSAAETVAAVDATHRSIEMADETCDGIADDVEIQEAIDSLP